MESLKIIFNKEISIDNKIEILAKIQFNTYSSRNFVEKFTEISNQKNYFFF
jgi:hypothetical protein